MIDLLVNLLFDSAGTALSMTRKTSNTLITASGMNGNMDEIEAVLNGNVDGDNIKDDGVAAAKLASDVVRSGYGLVQHTDGSLYVDVSDTNPGLEISDGGIRAKVYGLASRTANGIDIGRSGDLLLSSSSTTPDGWADVSTTYADKMIRISATALSTGGSDTLTGNTGSTTLTAAQSGLKAHAHTVGKVNSNDGGAGGIQQSASANATTENTGTVSAEDASEGHAHALTAVSCVAAYMTAKMFQKN